MRFYFVEKLEATEAEQQNGNVIYIKKKSFSPTKGFVELSDRQIRLRNTDKVLPSQSIQSSREGKTLV